MSKASIVELWLDHEAFGCGQRDFVAMIGRKWVRVVEVATGASAKIKLEDFLGAVRGPGRKRDPRELKPARIAKRLRRNAKTFGNDQDTHVKKALAALRAPS